MKQLFVPILKQSRTKFKLNQLLKLIGTMVCHWSMNFWMLMTKTTYIYCGIHSLVGCINGWGGILPPWYILWSLMSQLWYFNGFIMIPEAGSVSVSVFAAQITSKVEFIQTSTHLEVSSVQVWHIYFHCFMFINWRNPLSSFHKVFVDFLLFNMFSLFIHELYCTIWYFFVRLCVGDPAQEGGREWMDGFNLILNMVI